jgi:peptide/nickel transport system ATP-binding protein
MTATADAPGGSGSAEGAAVQPVLRVDGLGVSYTVRGDDRPALRNVSFEIGRNCSYGLVGESGSGKTTVALTITKYLPRNGRVSAGSVTLNGQDPLRMRGQALRALRAHAVSMVYQEPGKALNPSIKVGRQVAEVYEIAGLGRADAAQRSAEMLRRVQIPDPGRVMEQYPHQLSGGMAQRVVIAMAVAAEPSLLILDEPTTALDATVEAEVLDLVAGLREEMDTSILFISHNLAVIAKMCDRVGVLYAGELVEEGPSAQLFSDPRHPYTVGLLRCLPQRGQRKDHGRLDSIPGFLPDPGQDLPGCIFAPRCLLAEDQCRHAPPPAFPTGPGRISHCYRHAESADLPRSTPVDVDLRSDLDVSDDPAITVRELSKTFPSGHEAVRALVGVNLTLQRGETLGLVGESGSGKTTLARILLGLVAPDQGARIELDGKPLRPTLAGRDTEQLRALQIVFQNPDSALNRRHTVRQLIARPLVKLAGLKGSALRERLADLVRSVRMEDRQLGLRPRQLSGGLKQRVAIARAFGGGPRIVVCDEPTSALDVSVQAAILNLLADLQAKEQVSYLFISHDLGLVRYLSDRIAVLYLGRLMEVGPAERVFSGPHHPYTEALLSAVPSLDGAGRTRIRLSGEIPSAASPPSGCVFHTRCPRRLASGICETAEPPLAEAEPGHFMSCHIPIDQLASLQGDGQVA